MQRVLSGIVVAMLTVAPLPVCAHNLQTAGQDHQIGAIENSSPGSIGLPGSESGPTVTPNGRVIGRNQTPDARLRDESGVRGQPDTESGPAGRPA